MKLCIVKPRCEKARLEKPRNKQCIQPYCLILALFVAPTAIASELPVTWFDSNMPEQHLVAGSPLMNLYIDKEWRPRIITAYRGAESYGGPAWISCYQDLVTNASRCVNSLRATASQEGAQRLGFHPEEIRTELNTTDNKLSIKHRLAAQDAHFGAVFSGTLTNTGNHPLKLTHYVVWDLFYFPILKPTTLELLFSPPGLHPYEPWKAVKTLKNDTTLMPLPVPYEAELPQRFEGEVAVQPLGQRLSLQRRYQGVLAPTEAFDVATKNPLPLGASVYLRAGAKVFDALNTQEDLGNPAYQWQSMLANVLGRTERIGPVWAARESVILAPGESYSSVSALEFEGVAHDKITLGMHVENLQVGNASQMYPVPPPEQLISTQAWQTLRDETQRMSESMRASAMLDGATGKIINTQGSAYFYRFGLHTALRDLTNGIVGQAYLVPALARENLEYSMSLQDAKTAHMPYLWYGVHHAEGVIANGVRSDFDLSLLWALHAYLKEQPPSEGVAWLLNQTVPFYPHDLQRRPPAAKGFSPYDHVKAALEHFEAHVGFGRNGLPKIRRSDWSDSLLTLAGKPGSLANNFSLANGESVMVGQMAVVVLEEFIGWLEAQNDPALKAKLVQDKALFERAKNRVASLRLGLRKIYDNQQRAGYAFYPRAILRDALNRDVYALKDIPDLGGQVWGLMDVGEGAVLSAAERRAIIDILLQKNSTVLGVATVKITSPREEDYFRLQSGRTWSVLREWFTVALAKNQMQREAWEHLKLTSLSHHTKTFANERYPLMSGFDGWDPATGKAWWLAQIPMDDYRWNNLNHAGMYNWAFHELMKVSFP